MMMLEMQAFLGVRGGLAEESIRDGIVQDSVLAILQSSASSMFRTQIAELD